MKLLSISGGAQPPGGLDARGAVLFDGVISHTDTLVITNQKMGTAVMTERTFLKVENGERKSKPNEKQPLYIEADMR